MGILLLSLIYRDSVTQLRIYSYSGVCVFNCSSIATHLCLYLTLMMSSKTLYQNESDSNIKIIQSILL